MYQIKATNTKTLEILLFPNFYETTEDARLAIDHDIEWDEDDIQEDWEFDIVEAEDEYEEPADIDDDCGFDPYCGCYTYDCQGQQLQKKRKEQNNESNRNCQKG